jgi:glycosyltransferase involved in cell wall biosynthesis
MKISCVILTKNPNLDVSLLHKQFDEVVMLVDSVEKKSEGGKIFHPLNHDFAQHRNVALKHVNNEWVFFVDDDEIISHELVDELYAADDSYAGYHVARQDVFMGKTLRYGETAHVRLTRFGRKSAGTWKRPVHEIWDIHGAVGELHHSLVHHAHNTVESFIEKLNLYTSIEAAHRKAEGKSFAFLQLYFSNPNLFKTTSFVGDFSMASLAWQWHI